MTTQTDTKPQTLSSAQSPEDQHAYAIACCQKGLLKTLPELSFNNPETVAEAFLATLIANPKNTQLILKYLWEANPHVSWATQPILSRLATVAPKLAPKIFAHVFETQPQRLRIFARNIAFQSLRSESPDLLNTVLPYLSESSLRDLIEITCKDKKLPLAKMLVKAYPVEGSLDFLKKLSREHRQEVECILSEMQAHRIRSSLKSIPRSRSKSAKRKM